ncbi:MAG: nuclear transport factor 2 family protein [Mycobacterium sp.]|nr:nuclear transport factor 2 family protein [Mycobacterium sp.]
MSSNRSQIAELIYRYAELIDAGDFDGVGELLARAAFGGPGTPTVTGAQAIAELFSHITRRFPEPGSGRHRAGPGTPRTRHLVLNLIVEVDGDSAAARSTFCVVQATDRVPLQPIVVGRYYDRFARDGQGWYFTERIADVEMTGEVSDHLLIEPG